MYLMFKAGFLQKMKNLQLNGHCVKTLWQINHWIEDNIEDLYKQRNKHPSFVFDNDRKVQKALTLNDKSKEDYKKLQYMRYL